MALDIQTIAMTGSYLPYERPPEAMVLWSAIPRGLQSFIVDGQALDAKATSDEALLNLNGTLPPNFGYVMMDANLTVTVGSGAAGVTEWDESYRLNMQNFYRTNSNLALALNGNWRQELLPNSQDNNLASSSNIQPWPAFPIVSPRGASGILLNFSAFNKGTTSTGIGTVNFYCSFWQFDLEQIRKFPINTPIPTHPR